jgi:myo-inositol-hexaphosphate 3-phosphohydrolase
VEAIAKAFVTGPQGAAQVALFPDEVAVLKTKRGLLGKVKATDEVTASKRRAQIKSAAVDKEAGALEIAFSDGAEWRFEVAEGELTSAQHIVAELATSGPV